MALRSCENAAVDNSLMIGQRLTERRLTQQVGGSFRFIHRELLDHFAAMHDSTLEDAGSKSV